MYSSKKSQNNRKINISKIILQKKNKPRFLSPIAIKTKDIDFNVSKLRNDSDFISPVSKIRIKDIKHSQMSSGDKFFNYHSFQRTEIREDLINKLLHKKINKNQKLEKLNIKLPNLSSEKNKIENSFKKKVMRKRIIISTVTNNLLKIENINVSDVDLSEKSVSSKSSVSRDFLI